MEGLRRKAEGQVTKARRVTKGQLMKEQREQEPPQVKGTPQLAKV